MRTGRRHYEPPGVASILLLVLCIGCANGPPERQGFLRLDLDRADPRSFISYYFGGLSVPDAVDPFQTGLIVESEGDYYLNSAALAGILGGSPSVTDANKDGTLDWDELEPFLQTTYYARRPVPASFDTLLMSANTTEWFEVSVDGVMTNATRKIRVPLEALQDAIRHYRERGDSLIYPLGTLIIADHVADDLTIERTVMRKRADGHWDYGVFDSTGSRVPSTTSPPKPLAVPTQCVGCHLGSRLYEPEKSFPAPAPPGPAGPRSVHWDGAMPTTNLVRYFDEHRKRSDGILGLYATLYVADLEARRSAGTLTHEDSRLLDSLGI
jgi:hypothetical protein